MARARSCVLTHLGALRRQSAPLSGVLRRLEESASLLMSVGTIFWVLPNINRSHFLFDVKIWWKCPEICGFQVGAHGVLRGVLPPPSACGCGELEN